MSYVELYAEYFPVGKKVGVGIPMPNAEVFNDWAIIHDLSVDLVTLQLSRDVLPVGVSIHYGQIVELHGGNEGNGFGCRAIVVSEGEAKEFLLRLIGEVVSDELREFYRIDAFLPIKYFISSEQDINKLRKLWEKRRNARHQLEHDQKDVRWADPVIPVDGDLPLDGIVACQEISGEHEDVVSEETIEKNDWDSLIPLAANISGGGIRFSIQHSFEIGEYTLLEIMVPTPRHVIDVIGRVVFANRNKAAGNDREYFNIGVQFVYIDERDRDAISNYLSTIQLKRIRQMRENYLFRSGLELEDSASQTTGLFKNKTAMVLTLILIALLSILVTNYFWYYVSERPKGQIQRLFEESVRQYREQGTINLR